MPAAPAEPSASGRRGLAELALRALLAGGGLLGAAGLAVAWRWGAALAVELGPGYWALLASLLAATAASGAALVRRRRSAGGAASFLRAAFTLAVGAHVALLAAFPAPRPPYAAAVAGLAAGALALLVVLGERPRGALRLAELGAFTLALTVVAAELVLRLVAATLHPLILAEATDATAWIRANRLRPGTLRFGFPANSRGFYDAEPSGRRPRVAVIGDSFSLGTVALPLHYTSIAEQELPGWELDNVGVPGADPSHYHQLLVEEVLPREPDAIVVALFVGNDLEFEQPAAGAAGPLAWLGDRRASLLARVVVRVARIVAERGRAEGGAAPGLAPAAGGDAPVAPEEVLRVFPWFADPLLEVATFSPAGFLRIELERALAVTRASDDGFACFPWLERIRAAAGTIPLLVLLIPDEFQVEDDVWAEVLAGAGGLELERDLPQALVTRFCREHGIPVLDLLPALRAVPPLADGRRHLYALRDTHWNARGNAVAGRELARALPALLGR